MNNTQSSERSLLFTAFAGDFSALFFQTLLFRTFFNSFSGTAWSIAFFFGGWLLWTGFGGMIGHLIPVRRPRLATVLVQSLLFLPAFAAQYYFTVHARSWIRLPGYEAIPALDQLLLPLLFNAPIPLVSGFMFVRLSALRATLRRNDNRLSATRIYTAGAAGSLCGGLLLTVLLYAGMPLLRLAALALLAHTALMAHLLTSRTRAPLRAAAWLLPGAMLLALFTGLDRQLENRVNQRNWQRHVPEGHFQHAFSTPSTLYLTGRYREDRLVQAWNSICERIPTPEANIMTSSLLLSQVASPRDILVIGQGTWSLCQHLTQLSGVQSVTWVTTDPRYPVLIERAFSLQAATNTSRLHLPPHPPRNYLRRNSNRFDAILVKLPPGNTLGNSAYLTDSFFRLLKAHLTPNGALFLNTLGAENYISEERGYYGAAIYHTLETVFDQVIITPGDTGWLLAADRTSLSEDAATNAQRLQALPAAPALFMPEAAWMLFDRVRSQAMREHYQRLISRHGDTLINRTYNPVPPLFAMLLMIRQSMPQLPNFIPFLLNLRTLAPGILLLVLLLYAVIRTAMLVRRRPEKTAHCAATALDLKLLLTATGFCGFSLHLLLMFLYQTFFDTLYAAAGLLSALFMTGIFLGSRCASSLLKHAREDQLFASASLFYLLLCAAIYPVRHLTAIAVFLLLFTAAGFVTGFSIPPVESCALRLRAHSRAALWIVFFDAIGSTLGALLSGLFILPLLGCERALILLAIPVPAVILPAVIARQVHAMNKERLKFIIMVVLLPLAGICGLLAFNQKNASWLTREKYRKYKAERRAAPVTNTAKAAFVPPPTPIAEPTSSPVAAQWTASTVQTPSGTPYPYEQRTTDDGQTLYRLTTLPFSDGIMGYAGPIPMRIIVDQKRKLHQVEFLENSESPAYFARVTNWAQRLIGHAVPGQAQNHQIDALTGATYSSDAIRQSLTQTCNRFFELIESPEAAAAQPTPQPTLSTPYSRLPGTPRNIDQKRIRTLIENNELSDQPAAFAVPTDP